jgi:hypothetical protein
MMFDAFQSYLIPSLSDLEQQSLGNSGLDDGVAGRAPRSHHEIYVRTFEQGQLFRRAMQREIALTFGPSCRCPTCREVFPGAIGGNCTSDGSPLQWGMETLYGPGDPDDDCDHYSPDELRRLVLDGVPVLTLQGEILNEQILVQ